MGQLFYNPMKGCKNHCYTGIEEGKDIVYFVLYYLSKGLTLFEAHILLDFDFILSFCTRTVFTSSLIDSVKREMLDYSFHWKVVFCFLETRYLFVSQLTFV